MSSNEDQDDVVRRPSRDTVTGGLRLAEDLLRVGDTRRAAEAYADVAKVFAGRGEVMQAVAVCFRALQVEPSDFVSVVGDVVLDRLGPASRPLLERALESHEANHNYRAASDVVARLIQHDPDSVRLRVRQAELLHCTGRTSLAVDKLWDTARVLERDGNNAEFIEVARRLLDLAPDHLEARRALARTYLRVGDLSECLGAVSPLVKASDDPIGLEILARLQVELGRNERAIEVLRRLAAVRVCAAQRDLADEALAKASRWAFDDEAFRAEVAGMRERLERGEDIRPPSREHVDDVLAAEVVELSIELGSAETSSDAMEVAG